MDEDDDAARMLSALGVSAEAEARYLELIRAEGHDVAGPRDPALEELASLGLVTLSEGSASVVPVSLAFRGWSVRRDRELERARRLVEAVAEDRDTGRYVELLRGNAASHRAFLQLQEEAETELCGFDRGPYVVDPASGVSEAQPAAIARGVVYRAIYDSTAIASPELLANFRAAVAMGEEARLFPGLPMKLFISDRRLATIVVLNRDRHGEKPQVDSLLIHASPMLDAVCALFDAFWRLSVPASLDTETGEERDPEHRRLLELLTAGLTDQSIANELGVSERTVQRRIQRLAELLGAQTRFQLGVQAARHNWL